ncbi:MAG: tetratricopeptide repeat protein [Candidatus Manganitrophus sp.]|nr:MAG: tetratricopeptide repeat protein [Candidatus Manganitrophus sp.]
MKAFQLLSRSLWKRSGTLLWVFSFFLLPLFTPAVFSAEKDDSALFFEGHDLMEKRQPEKAIPIFEEVLQKYPQSKIRDLALFWLGRAYLETKQTDKSRETLSQLDQAFPESPSGQNCRE